jgi:nucleoid DNA-binding protein
VDAYAFLREELVGPFWDTWPELVGQLSTIPMTLAVCLCGTPQLPRLGGLHGGHTPNAELTRLMDSLQEARELLDGTRIRRIAQQELALPEDFAALSPRLGKLERRTGRLLARGRRGRGWVPPVREPASGASGTLTRDKLVRELQKCGLLFREARRMVNLILNIMIEELQLGDTVEEELLGTFKIVRRPPEKQLVRFGRRVTVNQQLKRVAFKRSKSLKAALRSEPRQEVVMPQTRNPKQLRCEVCGSIEFTEAEFRRYLRDPYASMPGGDLVQLNKDPETGGDLDMRALICLCGNPILPGRLRRQTVPDRESFWRSYQAARRYRDTQLPQALERELTDRYVSKQEYDRLAERVANLAWIVEQLAGAGR